MGNLRSSLPAVPPRPSARRSRADSTPIHQHHSKPSPHASTPSHTSLQAPAAEGRRVAAPAERAPMLWAECTYLRSSLVERCRGSLVERCTHRAETYRLQGGSELGRPVRRRPTSASALEDARAEVGARGGAAAGAVGSVGVALECGSAVLCDTTEGRVGSSITQGWPWLSFAVCSDAMEAGVCSSAAQAWPWLSFAVEAPRLLGAPPSGALTLSDSVTLLPKPSAELSAPDGAGLTKFATVAQKLRGSSGGSGCPLLRRCT